MPLARHIIDVRHLDGCLAVAIYRRPFPWAPRLLSTLERLACIDMTDLDPMSVSKNGIAQRLFPEDNESAASIGLEGRDLETLLTRVARVLTRRRAGVATWLTRLFAVLGVFYFVTSFFSSWQVAHMPRAAQYDFSGSPAVASTPASSPSAPAAAAPPAGDSGAVATAMAARMGPLSIEDAVKQSVHFTLKSGTTKGPKLVVWADPLCPHCRDLEPQIEALPADVGVTVIPVSFQPDSRPLTIYVACGASEAAVRDRWTHLMAASPSIDGDLGNQCAAGGEVADRNSTWFVRAGLTATPSIGRLKDGHLQLYRGDVTRVTTAELVAWAKS